MAAPDPRARRSGDGEPQRGTAAERSASAAPRPSFCRVWPGYALYLSAQVPLVQIDGAHREIHDLLHRNLHRGNPAFIYPGTSTQFTHVLAKNGIELFPFAGFEL